MKYLTLLPLAGLAIAAPGSWVDEPVKETTTSTTTTTTAATWADTEIPVTVTETTSATGTYCPKSGKYTYPAPGNDVAKCTVTVKEVTVTKATATVTVTKTESSKPTGTGKKCLSDKEAEKIVDNFRDLLEYTSFQPTAERPGLPGRGYHFNVSAATLAPDFTAFDYGQGVLQPEVKTETLNIFHECNTIVWRWKITPITQTPAYPVVGINYMIINDKGLIQKNYAEFDNGAWISSFGPQAKCGQAPISVVPGKFATKH
ncbi:uncharacterized protein AB675_2056 [Cyphellophora attinorum]|uniref:NTF2-like domain-containing protein n=1 Tax=Cyphellophora attinorum TaxID=1664694 RepID=A0A0N1HDN2_9EURO|nr:uncharacterized protein AB675_2056 [Phialophora attinorum]KPI42810.1 hypothetical protein AB675_2056 [Phialophora attinorum]